MQSNIVVYTAISGNYDNLKEPTYIDPNCDYVCFADNPKLKSNVWKIKAFPECNGLDSVRKCRKMKILPHRYFPHYKYSIWIDGNVDIIDSVVNIFKLYLDDSNKDLATFKHPERDCIYEEAKECLELNKDNKDTIKKQIKKYKEEGFPEHFGLIESNVILRRNGSKNLNVVMEDWWKEVKNYSKRDQLSFNYVIWKDKFSYSILPGSSRNESNYFQKRSHKESILHKIWIRLLIKKNKIVAFIKKEKNS